MNKRVFDQWEDDTNTFYELEPPWHSKNTIIIKRLFALKESFDKSSEALTTIAEIESQLEENKQEVDHAAFDFTKAVADLIRGLEEFYYCFPDLVDEEWFHSLWQAAAGAHWRAEEGRFRREPERILYHIGDITDHVPDVVAPSPHLQLENFLYYGNSIYTASVSNRFKADLYEARDLVSIGYYSTALMVLGRAVEKALLTIGEKRKVVRIKENERTRDWEEASFRQRARALHETEHPTETGNLISEKQYLEISILIKYRNNVAHSDYENIEKEEAIRKAEDALHLLADLDHLIEELDEIEDEKIDERTVYYST